MRRHVAILGAALLLIVVQTSTTLTQSGSPLANREHPRIWITRSNLPAMRTKLSNDFRSEYQAMINRLNANINKTPIDRYDQYDMMSYAFAYAVGDVSGVSYGGNTPARYGDRAHTLLNWFVQQDRNEQPFVATTYDWIYSLLSAGERSATVDVMVRAMAARDFDGQGTNAWHSQSMNGFSRGAIAGISFSGDGVNDAAATTMVDTYYRSKLQGTDGLLDLNSFTSGDGAQMQGMWYALVDAPIHTFLSVPMALEAWRTANGLTREEVFGASNANYMRNYEQWLLYRITPFGVPDSSSPGGRQYKLAVDHNSGNGYSIFHYYAGTATNALAAVAGLYKTIDSNAAGLSQWLMNNRVGPMRIGSDDTRFGVFSLFVAGEKGVTPKGPTDIGLPLTKHFTGYGLVVMNTSWTDPAATQLTYTASKYTTHASTYEKYNSGSFTIDRNGPLAISAGQGGHGMYRVSTWANNTIIFPDPNEANRGYNWDKGGQRLEYGVVSKKSDLAAGTAHDLGGIKRILEAGGSNSPDFDYIFSDVTRAYNGDGKTYTDRYNTAKVRNFTRQFVYFRPPTSGDSDRIVIFDRTQTTDTRFQKRWLLHTSGNPQIDGSETRVRDGKWSYPGANVVTQTNTVGGSNGKLFSTTLLPAAHTIYKIGGPDASGNWSTSGSHEMENPYGVNEFDQGQWTSAEGQWVGTYRVEVVPTNPSLDDNFLHVLETGSASMSSRTPTVGLSGAGVVAARVGDKIAAFSSTERTMTSGNLIIDQPGSYWLLLCDLTPGVQYTFSTSVSRVASSAGTIYLQISVPTAGSQVTFSAGGAAPPPAPPTQVQMIR